MPVLVIIADMVASRHASDRNALQQSLQRVLAELNQQQPLLSPYTITLGDEFQAVLADAQQVFQQCAIIQAALYPVRVRFSLAIGDISTEINRQQALGMDGPAFYAARDGIELLRKNRGLYHVSGLPGESAALANASLQLLSHNVNKWKQHRHTIMAALGQGHKVKQIAEQLGISDKAVYKSISTGAVEYNLEIFRQLAILINQALKVDGIPAIP